MPPIAQRLLRWHAFLCLPRQPRPWDKARLREELLEKLSETADVFYIVSRSHHDGHALRRLPDFILPHLVVYSYLLPKYTLRWRFYRLAARLSGCVDLDSVREVVNPAKDHKLHEVARRHGIDPDKFQRICHRLRMVWPLLP